MYRHPAEAIIPRTYWLKTPTSERSWATYGGWTHSSRSDPSDEEHGNLISSICVGGLHAPVLDVDFEVRRERLSSGDIIVSELFNRASLRHWRKLLRVLVTAGVCTAERGEWEILRLEEAKRHHMPVIRMLPMSVPFRLLPSSTKGHFHLYVDHAIEWKLYFKLLKSLCKTDVIEKEYFRLAKREKMTCVLKQGLTKATMFGG
jgi:hypothetical protein